MSPAPVLRTPRRSSRLAAKDSDSMQHRNQQKSESHVVVGVKSPKSPASQGGLPQSDMGNVLLLVALYLLQGVPLGLAMGSMPFLLKQRKLSYAQMATFSLASYPYSLKLFWSPIVDSYFSRRLGRRKSWIVPMQMLIGMFLLWIGTWINVVLTEDAEISDGNVWTLALTFVILVFMSATQDIAVDGWALTLLKEDNLSYASTSQTIGLNTGYFMSFTVVLALHSESFCNSYLRSVPSTGGVLDLGVFIQFWGWVYLAVTAWLVLFIREDNTREEIGSIKSAYWDIWRVIRLPNMQTFIIILLTAKLGFITSDNVTAFKLLEKGFKEEDLGLTALINFPLSIIFGYYAAKWSRPPNRLKPWLWAFYGRLTMAIISMIVLRSFPTDGVSNLYFFIVILTSVLGSFMSSVQFVSLGAFFAHISDPLIGGTYMTLLNTLSNFGGTYPQYFILRAVDFFTDATCHHQPTSNSTIIHQPYKCNTAEMKKICKSEHGDCVIDQDGYYYVSSIMIIAGLLTFSMFIRPQILRLESLKTSSWRVGKGYKVG